jgi:hypothetical protein
MSLTIGAPVRAERRQRRIDKRRREALPLFAALGEDVLESVAPLPTVSELERQERWYQAAAGASALRREIVALRSWLRHRALAEQYFTMDQIAMMEQYCRIFPSDPAYRADYWRSVCCECALIEGKGRLLPTSRNVWRRPYGGVRNVVEVEA